MPKLCSTAALPQCPVSSLELASTEASWVSRVLQSGDGRGTPVLPRKQRSFALGDKGLYEAADTPGSWLLKQCVVGRPLSAPACAALGSPVVSLAKLPALGTAKPPLLNPPRQGTPPHTTASAPPPTAPCEMETLSLQTYSRGSVSQCLPAQLGCVMQHDQFSLMEREVIEAVNLLRTNPTAFAKLMVTQSSFIDVPSGRRLTAQQGRAFLEQRDQHLSELQSAAATLRGSLHAALDAIFPQDELNGRKKAKKKLSRACIPTDEQQERMRETRDAFGSKEARLLEEIASAEIQVTSLRGELTQIETAAARLRARTPVAPLSFSAGLALAARDQCGDTRAPSSSTSTSSGGPPGSLGSSTLHKYGIALGRQHRIVVNDPYSAVDVATQIALRPDPSSLDGALCREARSVGCGWRRHPVNGSTVILLLAGTFQESRHIRMRKHMSLQLVRHEADRSTDPAVFPVTFLPLPGEASPCVRCAAPEEHPIPCGDLVAIHLRLPAGVVICASLTRELSAPGRHVLQQPLKGAAALGQRGGPLGGSREKMLQVLARPRPAGASAVHLHAQRVGSVGWNYIGCVHLDVSAADTALPPARQFPEVAPGFARWGVALRQPLEDPLPAGGVCDFVVDVLNPAGHKAAAGRVSAMLEEGRLAHARIVSRLEGVLEELSLDSAVLSHPLAEDFLKRLGAKIDGVRRSLCEEPDAYRSEKLKEAEALREELAYSDMHLRVLRQGKHQDMRPSAPLCVTLATPSHPQGGIAMHSDDGITFRGSAMMKPGKVSIMVDAECVVHWSVDR